MNWIEQTLTRGLLAHEIPVRRLCWNPGLSPPVEMFLDGDLTPAEHHRAITLLIELWTKLTSDPLPPEPPWPTSSPAPAPSTTSPTGRLRPTKTRRSTP